MGPAVINVKCSILHYSTVPVINWSNHNKTNGPSTWWDIFFIEVHFWAVATRSMVTGLSGDPSHLHLRPSTISLGLPHHQASHSLKLKISINSCWGFVPQRFGNEAGEWWQLMSWNLPTMDIRTGENWFKRPDFKIDFFSPDKKVNNDVTRCYCDNYYNNDGWCLQGCGKSRVSQWRLFSGQCSHCQVSRWPTFLAGCRALTGWRIFTVDTNSSPLSTLHSRISDLQHFHSRLSDCLSACWWCWCCYNAW